VKTRTVLTTFVCLILVVPICNALGAEPPAPWRDEAESISGYDMVLIHGLGSSAEAWHKLTPFLAAGFNLSTYELPGHGHTPVIPNLSIESASRDLARFIEDNALEEPILVGHGIGGMIAMNYAFRFANDVRRLIIIDAAPMQLASTEQKGHVAQRLMDDYDQFVAESFLGLSPMEKVTDLIVDQALRTDRVSFTQLLMSSFDFDLRDELAYQTVPILVIGSATMFPSFDHPLDYLDSIGYANAQTIAYKLMPETGHFVMLEQPILVANTIIAYSVSD